MTPWVKVLICDLCDLCDYPIFIIIITKKKLEKKWKRKRNEIEMEKNT